ncbi:hypothetical protein [Ekhidna sp.]
MINSKPKSSSILAVGLFLVGILAAAIWLFAGLIQNPTSYFWIKLILAPTVLVIGILVTVKSYSSAMTITIGNNKLTYRYLIGSESKHKIAEIESWQEDIIKRKSSEYRQLSMQLANGKKLKLSNHENSNYKEVVNYLKKKVKK